jgi:hypothetical protein
MTSQNDSPDARSPRDGAQSVKQSAGATYRTPRLRVYGSVADLTRAGAASALSDSGMNNMAPS